MSRHSLKDLKALCHHNLTELDWLASLDKILADADTEACLDYTERRPKLFAWIEKVKAVREAYKFRAFRARNTRKNAERCDDTLAELNSLLDHKP